MNNFTQIIKTKSNNELLDIYTNYFDYQEDFVAIVKNELQERNIDLQFANQKRFELEENQNNELKKGIAGSPLYIFFCFLLCLLGGFIGIYAGYIYRYSKQKNFKGEEFYVYNNQTRELGMVMLIIGIGVSGILLFYNIKL